MQSLAYLFALIPFYLIGTIPTGHLIAMREGVKIDEHGSGNVGATNVTRVLGKKKGALTLLGDVLKGFLAVAIASLLTSNTSLPALAAFTVVAGHCFSIPGKLKGGKVVATALGVILYISPLLALLALLIFATVLKLFKMVSLASVTAVLATPLAALFADVSNDFQLALAAIALLVVYRHKSNLIRITRGEEPYSLTTSSASGPK